MSTPANCALCKKTFESGDPKLPSKYGTLCLSCWSKKAGEIVESHPISDNEPHTQQVNLEVGESATLADGVVVMKKAKGVLELYLFEPEVPSDLS